MDIFKEYLIYNWALVLILLAFIIMLIINVFLDKKTVIRMSILIGLLFVLSLTVFFEFYLLDKNLYPNIRIVLIAIRYSSTPFIMALIIFTIIKRARWVITIPAFLLLIIDIISIFTGIVFSIDSDGNMVRGVLGYLPYIVVGIYSFLFIYILLKYNSKDITDIIPIVFLAFAFLTGLVFPFIMGKDYSKIFTTTVAIAVFVYYVFLILQLTKKDALTGLLNRQAYYDSINKKSKDITAVISIDMNGLKAINDNKGHIAGDNAIISVSRSIVNALGFRQSAYRLGGDEFIVLCFKTKEEDLHKIVSNIRKNVNETEYSCSIGYTYNDYYDKDVEEMVKISDDMMYQDKKEHYKNKETKENK